MKITKKNHKKIIIISLVSLLLVGVTVGAYYNYKNTPSNLPASKPKISTSKPSIKKYPGPTDQEKKDTAQHKDDLARDQAAAAAPQQPATNELKPVTPVISSVSQTGQEITARAFIGGIVENNGTCSFTFSKGASSFVKTASASADASTTICYVTASISEFSSAGNWTATLFYSSTTAKGTSQPKDFVVN